MLRLTVRAVTRLPGAVGATACSGGSRFTAVRGASAAAGPVRAFSAETSVGNNSSSSRRYSSTIAAASSSSSSSSSSSGSTTSSSSAVSPRYGTALAVAAGSLPSGARRLLLGSAASSQAPLKVLLLLLLLAAALATSDRLTDRPTDRPTQTTHTRPFCPAPTTERADQVPQHAGGVQGPRHRRRRVEDHGTEGSAGICEKPVVGPHPG